MSAGADSSSATRPRALWTDLLLLAALVALLRLAIVACLGDCFLLGEELEKGAAAKALRDGLGLDWRLYAYHEYEGGGFVISHLDALAFALCGESLLALKLVALGVHLAFLAAAWKLAVAAGGRAAGLVLGLVVALAPGPWARLSLLALGIHTEALLFVALVLLLAGRAVIDGELRPRTLFALGLAAGFGVFFSWQLVVAVGFGLVLVVVTHRRALLGAPGLALAAGLALGLAPLAWMAAFHGAKVIDVHGQSLVEGPRAPFATLGAFLGSLVEGHGVLGIAGLVVLAALPATALAARGRWTAWIAAWLALQLVAYLVSGFAIGRIGHWFPLGRLAPLFLGWLLLSAVGLAALGRRGGGARLVALGLGAIVLGLGAQELGRTLAAGLPGTPFANLARLARTKGYQYSGYVRRVASRLPEDPAARIEVFLRFDEPDRSYLWSSLGAELFLSPATELDEIERVLAPFGEDARSAATRGLGAWLLARAASLPRAIELAEEAPEPWRAELLEAAGRHGASLLATPATLERDLALALERRYAEPWLIGFGHRLENARGGAGPRTWRTLGPTPWLLDPTAPERFVEKAPGPVRAALARGLARARAERDLASSSR